MLPALVSFTRNGSYLDMSFIEGLRDESIAIIGAGVTGRALFQYLSDQGVTPVVVDEKVDEGQKFQTLATPPADITLAIVSPGWKSSHPIISALRNQKTTLLSEVDFAWRIKCEIAPDQKWIALTGTNGKTTTIQMINSIFDYSGISGVACGNVGDTVIEAVSAESPYEYLALELSSFQIQWSKEARFEAAAILNIAEDHIDWHGSFDEYANAKMSLLNYCNLGILNGQDSEIVTRSTAWTGRKVFFSLETPAPGELGLVENILVDRAFIEDASHAEAIAELADIQPTVPHNVSNALAASGLALGLGISHEAVKKGLHNFRVDHHRLELVLTHKEIAWVNDSKATNPHAAIASILSFEHVVWIAGGLAKGASMESLVRRAAPRLRAAILIGEDRALIETALKEFAPNIPRVLIDNKPTPEALMQEIVAVAQQIAKEGDTVLLAPACASMDQFDSYAHRGNLFADTVRNLKGAL